MSDVDDRDDLGELADLPPDDPRVRAAAPRVRAQLRAYRDFVIPGDVPDGARVAEAERRLAEVLGRELQSATGDPRLTRAAAAAPGAGRRRGWSGRLGPRMRLALAALVLVVGGTWLYEARPRGPHEPLMRGTGGAPRAGDLAARAATLDDGSVRLEWRPSAEATSYTIVFLSPDLTEVARVADLRDTRYDLKPGAPPAGLTPGSRLLWRVAVMHGADEVAKSSTGIVTVP